jgi:hypothetical protein
MAKDVLTGETIPDAMDQDPLAYIDTFTDNANLNDNAEKTQSMVTRAIESDMPNDKAILYEQTKDKSNWLATADVLKRSISRLDNELGAKVLQLHAGAEAASVTNKDWITKTLRAANKEGEEFSQSIYNQYGDMQVAPFVPIKLTDVAALPENLAFSAVSMGAGLLAAAPLALFPEPTMATKAAAWALGTVASGKAAYEMSTYEIMQSYLEAKNEETPLTPETEREAKKYFNAAAMQYGLWEAVPEAISNASMVGILTAPLKRMVGKGIAGKIMTKIGGLYGEELATETITQMGQARIEGKYGMREGTGEIGPVEAFKEIFPQTFLLTTIMGGAGASAVAIRNKAKAAFVRESEGKNMGPEEKDKFTLGMEEHLNDVIDQQSNLAQAKEQMSKDSMAGKMGTIDEKGVYHPAGEAMEDVAKEESDAAMSEGGESIKLERYGDAEGRNGDSIFFSPRGMGQQDYGENLTETNIPKNSKLYEGSSSYEYVSDSNLLDKKIPLVKKLTGFDTLREVEDAYIEGVPKESGANKEYQQNPNMFYTAFQQVAAEHLKKKGFQGAHWLEEDELTPEQYQIWDKSIISNKVSATSQTKEEGDTSFNVDEFDAVKEVKPDKYGKTKAEERLDKILDAKERRAAAKAMLDEVKIFAENFRGRIKDKEYEGEKIPAYFRTTDKNQLAVDEALDEARNSGWGMNFKGTSDFVAWLKDSDKSMKQLAGEMESASKSLGPEGFAKKVTETTLLKNVIKALGQGRKQGELQARKDLKSVQQEAAAVIKKANIQDKDRSKFLRQMINNIQTETQLERAMAKIEAYINKLEAHEKKRQEVTEFIKAKKFKNVENLRKAMKLPDIENKMTVKQLDEFMEILEPYHEGDVFLPQRQIETVDKTDLAGIRTLREAREALAEQAGVPVEELSKIKVNELDRFRQDVALAEQNPLYKILVEETHRSFVTADMAFRKFEKELERLVIKARKSKPISMADKLVPTDDLVFDYLEAKDKADLEAQMTSEELELAVFLESEYAKALEYLIKTEALKTGRENYITHKARNFFEALKSDGLIAAAKEMLNQQKQQEQVFNILDKMTGQILPLEKFFQYSMKRTGGLIPTKNVARAAGAYFQTLYKKQALDSIVPKLMIYAQSLTTEKTTDRGLEFDQSIKNFMKEWINTKKGRKTRLLFKQGGTMDAIVLGAKAMITIWDLGFNIPVGIATNIGEAVGSYVTLGKINMAKGIARYANPKGQRVLEKYEGFTGKTLWRQLIEPSKNIGDKTIATLFGLFASSATRANKVTLLGMMTDQEYESEEISDERLTDIKLEMGRMRIISGGKSIMESTTEGGLVTQYKTWEIPILRTVSADLANLAKKVKAGTAWGSPELIRLGRMMEITTAALMLGAMIGDKDDDKSFIGQLLAKARREALTILGAIDPQVFLGAPRFFDWFAELGKALHQIAVLEKYKAKGRENELKGVTALKKMLIPRAVKVFMPDDTGKRKPRGFK